MHCVASTLFFLQKSAELRCVDSVPAGIAIVGVLGEQQRTPDERASCRTSHTRPRPTHRRSGRHRRNRPDLGKHHRHNRHPTGVVPPQIRSPEARRGPEPATPTASLREAVGAWMRAGRRLRRGVGDSRSRDPALEADAPIGLDPKRLLAKEPADEDAVETPGPVVSRSRHRQMRRQATQRRQAWATPAVGSPAPARGFFAAFSMPKRTSSTPAPTARRRAPPARPGRRCGPADSAHTGQGTRQTAKANTPARALRYAPASRSTPSALADRAPRQPARPQAASPKSPCSNQRRRHPATAPCDGPIHRATSARVGPPAIPRWPARASGPRRRGLTRSDGAASAPDLLGRDFSAEEVDRKWVGDFKQVGHRPRARCFSRPSRTPPPGRQHWPSPPGAATWPVIFWTLDAAPSLFIRITAH